MLPTNPEAIELSVLTPDITEGSLEELLLAHAEILGWLEGLFQAVQVALAESRGAAASTPAGESSTGLDRPDPRYL